ncbi:1-aminocyclopropane-1-carboxylate synthase-like [Camellia sinensis]|uniref:1-aminocyclopropane-1-carboxylate synthase-like n=1 Tax=Camellia sinensis TaxID=4442 RepID=UPI0010369CCB|nr:1-aminocyclopropane-1-carboxylate synthase-like [Camellia sinensis]
MLGNPRFLFARAWGTSRYRVLLEGLVGRAWFLGERFMRQMMGNSDQDMPSLPPPKMWSAGDLTPRKTEDLMLGIDAVLFLEEGDYATYRHTYLMPPLSGVRIPRRRAADMASSSRARAGGIPSTNGAGSSRDGTGWIPLTCQFVRDLRWRTSVQIIPVTCESSNNFQITIEALEEAYNKAIEANIRVKGLIITNPSNPLGTIFDKATLKSLVNFINKRNIHLVCDEIYAATIFKPLHFTSIFEFILDMDSNDDIIHIVYSLSKDMGFPSFRVGIVYSYNDEVVSCAQKVSSFGLVTSQTQYLLASMLSDNDFVGRFLDESSRRLECRHKIFTEGLKEMKIDCLNSNAGLFCWMDLRPLLKEPTIEAEMVPWHVIINDVKLNVSQRSSFHCTEVGWFRVCFANMDDDTVKIELQRI